MIKDDNTMEIRTVGEMIAWLIVVGKGSESKND